MYIRAISILLNGRKKKKLFTFKYYESKTDKIHSL